MKSHYDVIDDIRNGWDFRREFVRHITYPKTEWKDKHAFAYAMGAELEPTGNYFCTLCDGYLHQTACDGYEDYVKDQLRWQVVNDYIQATCPDCETPIAEQKTVEIVQSSPVVSDVAELPSEPPETEQKTRYQPCGCVNDIGDEMIRWDLDKAAVEDAFNMAVFES